MSTFLYEAVVAKMLDETRNKDLDYLDVYLIESAPISLQEAKDLIFLIEADVAEQKKSLYAKFKEALKNLVEKYKRERDAIKTEKELSAELKRRKVKDLTTRYERAKASVTKHFHSLLKSVKERGSQAKTAVGAAYRVTPRSGKIAGGVALAPAAGLAGKKLYDKNKKDK